MITDEQDTKWIEGKYTAPGLIEAAVVSVLNGPARGSDIVEQDVLYTVHCTCSYYYMYL